MKRGKLWIPFFLLLGAVLTGCSGIESFANASAGSANVAKKEEERKVNTTKEFVLYAEDEIEQEFGNDYIFNGFINENTLSFEMSETNYDRYKSISVYHPAEIGYKFRLKEINNIEFEIIDFSRKEGYVKLKITKQNQNIEGGTDDE